MTNSVKIPVSVLFDMDGTLLSTEALVLPSWIEAFAESGATLTEEDAARAIGCDSVAALALLQDAVGLDIDYASVQRRCGELFRERAARDGVPVKPGARRILSGLRELGVPVGLATSTRSHSALPQLRDAGLLEFFDAIVCGDEVEVRKPHPSIYLLCLERLRIADPRAAWAVEDSRNGILSARAAGLKVAHIPDIQKVPQEVLDLTDSVIQSLDELADLFGLP
jgi:HAD superfamily hydrolase (TIGR01509 family)